MIGLIGRACSHLLSRKPLELGARGEAYAAKWLKRRGYRIIARNLVMGDDEADLVAIDSDGTLIIVEVKTREQAQPPPEASVGRTKQHRMARTAARLHKQARHRHRQVRFDVIAIVWPTGEEPILNHWPGAFESPF